MVMIIEQWVAMRVGSVPIHGGELEQRVALRIGSRVADHDGEFEQRVASYRKVFFFK
jgi:hypothetical protein